MKHVMGTLLPQTGRMQVARPLLKLVSQWCNRLCGLAKHPSEPATLHVSTGIIKSVHASCCIWLLHLVNCYAATKVRCTLPSCRMLLCGSETFTTRFDAISHVRCMSTCICSALFDCIYLWSRTRCSFWAGNPACNQYANHNCEP